MLEINLETFDLNQLPETEDDFFEFKSSLTALNEAGELKKDFKEKLIEKLTCAVSGFANSGGGCFVVGIDPNGNADGGLPLKIGRQDLRDWVDKIIHQVEPVPQYEIKLIQDSEGRGVIKSDSAVLIVAVSTEIVASAYLHHTITIRRGRARSELPQSSAETLTAFSIEKMVFHKTF